MSLLHRQFITILLLLSTALFATTELEKVSVIKSAVDNIDPSLNLTEKEISFIKSHPEIIVGNDTAWPPFDFYENGQVKGYIIDFLKEVELMTGLSFKFVQDENWDNLVTRLKNRELDVLSALEPSTERKKLIDFSEPILTTFKSIVINNRSPNISSYKDLYGKKVAVIKGYAFESEIANNYPQIEMVLVENPLEGLNMLSNGKVDAFLENQVVVNYLINEYLISNVKISGSPQFPNLNEYDEILLASRNDWPELGTIFSKVIKNFPIESKQTLQARWLKNIKTSKNTQMELSKEEVSYLKQKENIKICADPSWMPFESIVNGKLTGMSADYIQLLSKKLNIDFNLVPTISWDDAVQKAKARECDIFPLAMETPQRKTFMNFTKPYLKVPLVIATTYDKSFIPELTDVLDKKLGAVKGYAFTELLRLEYPSINIIEYKTLHDALEATYNGEIYGAIDNLSTLSYTIHRSFPETLKISGRIEKDWILGVAARNDEPLLVNILDKALATIDDKTKREIHSKWVSVRYEQGTDYTLVWKIIGLFIFVFLISLAWYRRLQLANTALNLANKELVDQKKTFETLFEESSDGLLLLQNNRFVACNQKIIDIYECNSKDELLNLHPSQLSPEYQPDGQSSREKAEKMIKIAFEKGFNEFEWVHSTSKGTDFWCTITLNKIMVDSVESIYARVRNIDEEKKTQQALVQEREKLDSLINDMGERFVVFSHDIEGNLLYVSDGFKSVFGVSSRKVHNFNFTKWTQNSIQLWLDNTAYLLKNKSKNQQFEMSFIHPDGNERFISITSHIGYDKKNNIETIDGIIENITEQKVIELFIKEQAITDQLTGLYNRHKTNEVIIDEIQRSKRYDTSFCIAILDLDNFKQVNDTYGHLNGDKVLITIATILKEHKRSTDTIGRWGGEEFLIIAPHTELDGMNALAQKIRKAIEICKFTDMRNITASFGVTINTKDDTTHTLLARADSALYKAKDKGRNQVVCS